MSVIIKDMEMPKNCKECPFSDHEAWCLIPGDWRERYYCPEDERSEHCPLIELSPHVRLIDVNKLDSESSNDWVPVGERPPKQQQKILIQDFGDITIGYLNAENRWRDLTNLDDYLKGVEAWMPLPEPYQGVKK